MALLEDDDVRDRVATPAAWYSAFREATWEEALSLTAQELLRIRDTNAPKALAEHVGTVREVIGRILERSGHALRMVDANGKIHTVVGSGRRLVT